MAGSLDSIDVYLEVGKKRVFAGALDWPGWCRSGRAESAALNALVDYGPRYAAVLDAAGILFRAPVASSSVVVVERLHGNATTDFGAPDIAPAADALPIDAVELARYQRLLTAYWRAFDHAVDGAADRPLTKGPRGGGRDVEGIVRHVLAADTGYLSRLARKHRSDPQQDLREELAAVREAILAALTSAARGEVPAHGPRGGKLWRPRYFVRRIAWHVLDHLWEIEDRLAG